MTNRLTSVALLCAFAGAALPAMASSQATASLDNLIFTLYDLDLNDGITPSFSFLSSTGAKGSTTTSAMASDSQLGESGTDALTRGQAFLPRVASIELSNALAAATVQQFAVAAHGQAEGPSTSFNATASSSVLGNGGYYSYEGGLELSPNSLLIIQGTANASASAVVKNNCSASSYYYGCGGYSESASSNVSLSLSFNNMVNGNSVGSGSFTSQLVASAQAYVTGNYQYDPVNGDYRYVYSSEPTVQDKSGALSVTFTNNTGLSQRGGLSLSATVSGQANTGSGVGSVPINLAIDTSTGKAFQVVEITPEFVAYGVSAVPEPRTWLTMLTGLLGMSLVVRRARRG